MNLPCLMTGVSLLGENSRYTETTSVKEGPGIVRVDILSGEFRINKSTERQDTND